MFASAALFAFTAGAAVVSAQQPAWAQCGGQGWAGGTTCVSGYDCVAQSEWYSQCVPGTATSTPTTTTSTSTSASPTNTPTSSAYTLLTGSYTQTISTIRFDPAAGSISVVGSCNAGNSPSWVTTHPTIKTVHYSTNEDWTNPSNNMISSFTSNNTQRICSKVSTISSQGPSPAYILPVRNGTEVVVANYDGGTMTSYTLSSNGLNFSNGQSIKYQVSNKSHPHMVYENGQEVWIPDLGADKIWRMTKSGSQWVTAGFIGQPAGSGPRHIQVKGNVVFVLHELSNTLGAQIYSSSPSNATNPTTLSLLSVLPPNIPGTITAGRFHAAELILSPDGNYLYASNRDTATSPDSRGDAIAIFSVGSTGALTLVKHVFTGLRLLRGLSMSPDGKYIIGGGMSSGGLAAWSVVSGGADLQLVARNSAGPAAVSFAWRS